MRGLISPRRSDRIRIVPGGAGIERMEAHLHGPAFSRHRHDTYAIGMTVSGVQTFRYRGAQRHCLPGQCHILHPDEPHDGGAGGEEGFAYRIVYIDPSLIQDALAGRPLPFVADPVLRAMPFPKHVREIWEMDADVDEVAQVELATAAAGLLAEAAWGNGPVPRPLALDALRRVRDLLAASPTERHAMRDLERVAGLDRWALARQFRAAFGTSPGRFRTMRQLDRVRTLVRSGMSLVHAATEAGFADQSHMSRQFKRTYGLTPARWAAALA